MNELYHELKEGFHLEINTETNLIVNNEEYSGHAIYRLFVIVNAIIILIVVIVLLLCTQIRLSACANALETKILKVNDKLSS